MKTNMTDAGHGGYDSGAPGLHGCLEKDIVLEVSNKINYYLIYIIIILKISVN